ncbi:metallophosphoesterase [Bacillus sp. DNRA2]|uniref:metallophosphoesterase family protein n=1 Tax=Bacillus sp. DNRA2 TaxID=2723053 RepID=UPI00145D1193|nr:metallophosphoesterase [Bacillus sp. DNRA2]NMD70679.1 metallophosphoesterase [Bacillus sp. DNRA2]
MTKALIVSDSHRFVEELDHIKKKHQHEVDVMIHCGDSELFFDQPEIEGFVTVRGNCDYEMKYPDEQVVEFAGLKIFVTHGHLFSVKSTLMNLYYRAQELGANIVCFGHSHMLGMEQIDDILFINPGSIRLPRGRKERTYCILEQVENQLEVSVYDLDKGEIAALKQRFLL